MLEVSDVKLLFVKNKHERVMLKEVQFITRQKLNFFHHKYDFESPVYGAWSGIWLGNMAKIDKGSIQNTITVRFILHIKWKNIIFALQQSDLNNDTGKALLNMGTGEKHSVQ